MAEITFDIGTLIVSTPDIRGGRPRIAGSGVTVQRIVTWYKLGHTPEEIADNFRHLSLAQIYAALAYYYANQEEIDAALAEDEEIARQIEAQHASITHTA